MKFILNKDTLKIEDKYLINSGSVNYYEADVEYDESWNDLIIKAVLIKNGEEEGKETAVIGKKVFLDKEGVGSHCIGFVGYTIKDDEKAYQISTNLESFYIQKGAGEIETQEAQIPTLTEWELYITQIEKIANGVSDEIIDKVIKNIEPTLENNLQQAKKYSDDTRPTKTSELENDSDFISKTELNNKVDKISRENATNINSYNHELDSTPYLYGVYGDINNGYAETQGLIKGSTGIVRSELAKQFEENNPELAEEIRNGDVTRVRNYLDIHTVAIRDGNCSIPVGMLNDEIDEEGNEVKKLYYGSAIPRSYFQKYVDIHVGEAIRKLNIKNGTVYGLYQESEKEDTAVSLKFLALPEDVRNEIAGTYDRTQTGQTAVAFGSSVARGKRSMAVGSSNLVTGDASIVFGNDSYVRGNQSFSTGYANCVLQGATAGSCFGSNNIVKAENGHAHGINNTVNINEATAQGVGLIANNWAETVVGKYNAPSKDNLFSVGNGENAENRKNAFTVTNKGYIVLPNYATTSSDTPIGYKTFKCVNGVLTAID